jgi:hypothetical protein
MNRIFRVAGCVGITALFVGCSGRTLDLGTTDPGLEGTGATGSTQGGTAGSGTTLGGTTGSPGGLGGSGANVGGTSGSGDDEGPACVPPEERDPNLAAYLERPEWPDDEECEPGTLPELEGTWEGLVQGDVLGPFSGRKVTVEIVGSNSDAKPCGFVHFGDAEALPPPTDPDAPYPSYVVDAPLFGYIFEWSASGPGPLPGVPYTILSASVDGASVRFDVAYEEPYRSWCALQTPEPSELVSQDCYNCIGNETAEVSWVPGQDECTLAGNSVSCFRLGMCLSGTCWCSEEACEARNLMRLPFEIIVDGEEMQGVIGEPARAVWLKRQE